MKPLLFYDHNSPLKWKLSGRERVMSMVCTHVQYPYLDRYVTNKMRNGVQASSPEFPNHSTIQKSM